MLLVKIALHFLLQTPCLFSSELCETWTLLLELFHRRCHSSIDLLLLGLGFSRKDVIVFYQKVGKFMSMNMMKVFPFWCIAGDRNWQDWQPGASFLLTVTMGHVNFRDFMTKLLNLQTAGYSWSWAVCVCSETASAGSFPWVTAHIRARQRVLIQGQGDVIPWLNCL